MFKAFKNVDRKNHKGFSLVELLVVLLIMSIIAGIAVPLYLNQKQRSYLSLAQSDAKAIGSEVTSIVSDYTSFGTGTTTNTIAITGGVLVFGAMTAATGTGTFVATGPGATTSTVRVSSGSTLAGSYSANGINWCIVITNNSTYAKYNQTGLVVSQVAGIAPTCTLGV